MKVKANSFGPLMKREQQIKVAVCCHKDAESAVNPVSDAEFEDFGKPNYFRQIVGYYDENPTALDLRFRGYVSQVDNGNIKYNPFIRNSNSYAFQVVELQFGFRPFSIPRAPGWDTRLPVPK